MKDVIKTQSGFAKEAWDIVENAARENLPDSILTSVLRSIQDETHLSATRLPAAHFLAALSKPAVIQLLKRSGFTRELAAQALFYLSLQERLASKNEAWRERASLAARRWLISCCAAGKELLPRDIKITLAESDTLFSATLRADGDRFALTSITLLSIFLLSGTFFARSGAVEWDGPTCGNAALSDSKRSWCR